MTSVDQTRAANLGRFFPDGKTVILPVDHGTAVPVPGLESPADLAASVGEFVDGYVVNAGLAKAGLKEFAGKGICLRTDVYKPPFGDNEDLGSFLTFGSDDAGRLGAHAVMNMLYPHHPNEAEIAQDCAELVAAGLENGVPVIIEALPFGLGRPGDYTPEHVGFAVRMAAELGADVVKTAYPGDRDAFSRIVASCYVPVIVLGGAASGDPEDVVRMVADAMAAGASGVAVGRNVWQHAAPAKMAAAMAALVHGGERAASAIKLLR